ncbi:MAG: hypothetical protein AAGM40_22265, partial [Cyanobacteria bacterium J06573_2]
CKRPLERITDTEPLEALPVGVLEAICKEGVIYLLLYTSSVHKDYTIFTPFFYPNRPKDIQ